MLYERNSVIQFASQALAIFAAEGEAFTTIRLPNDFQSIFDDLNKYVEIYKKNLNTRPLAYFFKTLITAEKYIEAHPDAAKEGDIKLEEFIEYAIQQADDLAIQFPAFKTIIRPIAITSLQPTLKSGYTFEDDFYKSHPGFFGEPVTAIYQLFSEYHSNSQKQYGIEAVEIFKRSKAFQALVKYKDEVLSKDNRKHLKSLRIEKAAPLSTWLNELMSQPNINRIVGYLNNCLDGKNEIYNKVVTGQGILSKHNITSSTTKRLIADLLKEALRLQKQVTRPAKAESFGDSDSEDSDLDELNWVKI